MTRSAAWTLGIDTGGTFTDLVLVDDGGTVRATHKRLSTPEDPARAVLLGIAELLQRAGLPTPSEVRPHVVHGSTVATNALLEGGDSGAMLLTTAGFEDVLAIARQNRPDLYALTPQRDPPPIDRPDVLGIDERIDAMGNVVRPVSQDSLDHMLDAVALHRPQSVAVCLLHSYANPRHEQLLVEALRERFGDALHLTVSSDLSPEYREYERTATCVINAAVAPKMVKYVGDLEAELGRGRLRIMGSHGGTLPPAAVTREPVRTILSGPAGGVLGAAALAGEERLITFDMGGTSTDVALLDGEPRLSVEHTAAGVPVRLPMLDIHTVGAGGGSVGWVDAGGALRVGPKSTGAVPGPACYGRQTGEPVAAVTDAHVVLGHLPPDHPLGEGITVQRDLAVDAVQRLGVAAGLSLEQTALGMLRVAEVAMARAIGRISLQRGRDPRRFALVPFGGAGGLHVCRLAEALGIRRVIVPSLPGLLSAVGMLSAPPRHAFSRAVLSPLRRGADALADEGVARVAAELRGQATAALEADAVPAEERVLHLTADLRYAGQSYEITVDMTNPVSHFEAEHRRLYGYADPNRDVEIVALRVEASGARRAIALPPPQARSCEPRRITLLDADGSYDATLIPRDALAPGQRFLGPLVITEYSATTLVPRNWVGQCTDDGRLILEPGA